MNKPPISIQYSTTTDTNSVLNEGRTNTELSKQPSQFVAHNVQIKPGSLQMEVEIDGRWQTIRLATKESNLAPLRLNEAIVTLSDNGQSLSIKSADQVVNIKAPNELLSLLTLLKLGSAQTGLSTQARVISGSNPQLLLEQIGIKLALDPSLAKILKDEHKLIAQLQATPNKVQLKLVNGFADQLFSSVLSKQKIAEQLATQGKGPLLYIDKHAIQIKFSAPQKPLSVTLNNLISQPQSGPAKWQSAKLQSSIQGVQIKTLTEQYSVDLKQSIKGKFDQIPQFDAQQKSAPPTHKLNTLNYAKPIFNITFQDIKKAVEQAINQWLTKPFKQPIATTNQLSINTQNTVQSLVKQIDLPLMLKPQLRQDLPPIVKLIAQIKTALSELPINRNDAANTSQPTELKEGAVKSQKVQPEFAATLIKAHKFEAVPKGDVAKPQKFQSQFMDTLTKPKEAQQVAHTTNTSPHKFVDKQQIPSNLVTPLTQSTASKLLPMPQADNLFKTSLPIERALLGPLLKLGEQPAVDVKKPSNSHIITEKIVKFSQYKHPQSIDMTKLVNQAFSRMIDANNVSASLIASEINTLIPGLVPAHSASAPTLVSNNFTQALDKLLVTLLASPKAITGASNIDGNEPSQRLSALLETLLPSAKNVSAKQLLPHLQQLNTNLLSELSQLQNNFSTSVQVTQTSPQKVDSETQLLLSLLMPMKVPAECKQTELQIGNYKKPAKAKMPEKTVWFVRLNFDYAHLGKLSAHAELMDKALECEIIGNSTQICDLAKPHLDALRRKLCAHGLQVNEITLTEDEQQLHTFYEQHAIVNIKV